MKKIAFLSILILTFLLSCEKETILSVDQTSINISDAGGSSTVSLTANKPWTASSNQSWCKVSPSSGEEATSSRITISCDPNTTYDTRNATVTFTCAEMTKQVSITQATNNGLLVSQTSYELTKAAQQLNIEVKANVKFSVEVDSGCKDWVKYNTTKGLTTSTVVLDIAENTSYDGREGKVTIKQDGGSLSSTVTIKQSQLDGLFLTTSEYNLSNEKHTLTVEVSTNVEFDVKTEADWVKYVQTKGLNTKQIVLEVAENETYDQRETKVNVKQKNGDLSGTITIKQDEKYGILISQSEYNLTNEAQNIDVEVKYNVDFEVSIPDGCKDWIKQVSTKGLNTKNYTFSVAKNETYDNREGSITFKQKKGSLSGTVAIKQAQTDYLEVTKNEFTVDIEGETITIEVTSNVDYTVSISEDAQSWLSKVGTKGLSKDNVQIAVAAGDDNTDRKGEIVISYGEMKRTIKVHQYSYAATTIIKFADEKVKAKLVEAFDTNKDGELSIKEAREVKSIDGVFGAIKTYNSFDEFQYFTGVNSIPAQMFKGWRLTSIILPESIDKIGREAFAECVSLVNIKLPSEITDIGYGAFMGCSSLKEITIPEGLKILRGGVFCDCSSLSSITFPKSLVSIDDAYYPGDGRRPCFRNCTSLKSIVLPNNLTQIGGEAFLGCSSLSKITIPPSVQTIAGGVFQGCESLKKISIPQGVSFISSHLFHGCKELETVEIPDSITSIYDEAFSACSKLASIIIPDGTVSIGAGAFRSCESLTAIHIPETVSSIGYSAFFNCTSLASINLPESISTLSGYTFAQCYNLEDIIIPESVTSIEMGVFAYCTSLQSISIPESVTSIGWEAFYDCISLSFIDLPNSITNIGPYAFHGCTNLSSITIPSGVSILYEGTFFGCTNLISVLFPQKIERIGAESQDSPPNYYSTRRDFGCFENCTKLSEITIPEMVSEMGAYLFRNCASLSKIDIPNSVTTIYQAAFAGCKELTSIKLPTHLSTIHRSLFSGCSKLSNIIIPESVTIIREDAFSGCTSLTDITIPKSTLTIGDYAFSHCSNLKSIFVLPEIPPEVRDITQVFDYDYIYKNNCIFYVPSTYLDIYKTDEKWKAYADWIQAMP